MSDRARGGNAGDEEAVAATPVLVSVVINNYNYRRYLCEAVDTIRERGSRRGATGLYRVHIVQTVHFR